MSLFCLILSYVALSNLSLSSHNSEEKCLSDALGHNGNGGHSTSAYLDSNTHISLKSSGINVPVIRAPLIPAIVPLEVAVNAEADAETTLNIMSSLRDHSSDNNVDSTESASSNTNESNDAVGPFNTLKKISL